MFIKLKWIFAAFPSLELVQLGSFFQGSKNRNKLFVLTEILFKKKNLISGCSLFHTE